MKKLITLFALLFATLAYGQFPQPFYGGIKTDTITTLNDTLTIQSTVVIDSASLVIKNKNIIGKIFSIKNSDGTDGFTILNDNTMTSNAKGSYNEAFGEASFAIVDPDVGAENTAFGSYAMYQVDSMAQRNTAFGKAAMGVVGKNSQYNTAMGVQALRIVGDSAWYNVAVGYRALGDINSEVTGSNNTAVGANTLKYNTTGSFNTALGVLALRDNTTGSHNVAVGYRTLYRLTSGDNNTAIGNGSGEDLIEGGNNTLIGYWASKGLTHGDNNTFLGSNLTAINDTLNNKVFISDGAGNIVFKGDGISKDIEFFGQVKGLPAIDLDGLVTLEQMQDSISYTVKEVTTSTYTLLPSDGYKQLNFTNACIVTVPASLSIGEYQGIQMGTGQVSFVSAFGVDLYSGAYFAKSTAAQYSPFQINMYIADKGVLFGDLEVVGETGEMNVQSDWSETDTSSDAYIVAKPTVPTNNNEITNGEGYITEVANLTDISTRNFSDLQNIPTIKAITTHASGDYTVLITDVTIICTDATDEDETLTIPIAATGNKNRVIKLVAWSEGKGFSEDYFNHAGVKTSHTGTEPIGIWEIQSDGADWYLIDEKLYIAQ